MHRPFCDDDTLPDDSVYYHWGALMADALEMNGVNVRQLCPRFFRDNLEAAGFVDITVYTYKVPYGRWPKGKRFKHIGVVCAEVMSTGIEAYALLAMTRLLNMPEDEARKLCRDCYDTIMAEKQHCYYFQ
ncbi:hypothetical protein EX30DRAFT_351931 [Ascodesmis nigricans]|uniref:Uncharacterized protein n=1 Tax=Ascodesmis nigricans TaxID=341454 RepID=A0A4S2MK37_9PEZI|nr:hypothetical protein EX30DRAFT_351931 [Ascodesmis nigricans]